MKKALKIILIALASIIVLLVIITLIASPIAKNYVNKHGEELIGRQINIDHLKVNVYNGKVQIYDLKVFEDDGTTEFLTFDTLDVQVKILKLLNNEVHVNYLTLANLKVNVLQNGSNFNFTSILDHFADTTQVEEEKDTTASNWKLGFYNVRLAHWKVYYADKQTGSEWDVKDINIEVPGVYFDGNQSTDAGINLALADGGELNTQVNYTMETNDFNVNLDLKNIALSNIKAYITDIMNINSIQGMLSANLNAKGNLSELLKMNISGNANIAGIDLRTTGNDQVLKCQNIGVNVNKVILDDNIFDIASVTIDGLASHFDLYANTNNFSQLFDVKTATVQKEQPKPEENSTPEPAEPSKPMNLRIGQLRVNNADIVYNDHTLHEPFSFHVANINIASDNLTLSGDNSLTLKAVLPHGGMANIDWKGSLDDIKRSQRLKLDIRNLRLADLSPYTIEYLGQPFTDGIFSFTSLNTINHSQLKGDNRIDIYKPEVGKRRKDIDSALHIPLKAALYILKDKNDKVLLDVPISGNIDSPEFNYMKLVWKTLGNLFVKVATSPARRFAELLGISNNDIEFLAFDPNQSEFTSEQYYILDQLAQVTSYDSNLVIVMKQQVADSVPDSLMKFCEMRNQAVLNYFNQIGVRMSQIEVSNSDERDKRTGFAIESKLRKEDE